MNLPEMPQPDLVEYGHDARSGPWENHWYVPKSMQAYGRACAERGYLLGFTNSGEGWNGEYPFEGRKPEEDAYWIARRDESLAAKDSTP